MIPKQPSSPSKIWMTPEGHAQTIWASLKASEVSMLSPGATSSKKPFPARLKFSFSLPHQAGASTCVSGYNPGHTSWTLHTGWAPVHLPRLFLTSH